MRVLVPGTAGEAVRDLQARLAALGYRIDPAEHGRFGPATERAVREFQERRKLIVDGRVGPHTWNELVEAGYALGDRVLYLRYPYFRGDDVRALQRALNLLGFDAGREDGILGERTDRAIKDFQRNVGLPADGIVGSTTVQALRRLRPVAPGPGRADVREGEALRRLSASLRGARIAVDAAPTESPDLSPAPGEGGDSASSDPDAYATALALASELEARGAVPVLVRGPRSDSSQSERARAANAVGAEVLVSVQLDGDRLAPAAARCYYYGREGWFSRAGRRLAELLQQEVTAQLALPDGGVHPRAVPILRETRMPAVQVSPGTPEGRPALMRDPGLRGQLARALADGVERFLGGAAAPSPASGPDS